ncbi:MAG: hypothetical protein AAB354_08775 [candidate division KSB1 bacterium]
MEMLNERSERLLVLLLLQNLKQASLKEKIIQLNLAGFSNIEIAEFLQTTPAVVGQELSLSKDFGKPRKRKS